VSRKSESGQHHSSRAVGANIRFSPQVPFPKNKPNAIFIFRDDLGGSMGNTQFNVSRRSLVAALAATPALTLQPANATPADDAAAAEEAQTREALRQGDGTKLVLLGTGGGPVAGQARRMTSHVMLHKGAAYVVDCGLGATRQFARTGIPFRAIRAIFITHHHPDHNLEYGPFLMIGWMGGMQQPARTYGPPPLTQMTDDYFRSQKVTIDFWAQDFKIPLPKPTEVHDVTVAGPVMQDDNVKVTSALVQHPPVTPAYGYRFDFPDRSIAFSGDTVAVQAMVKLAQGADILIHEAIDMQATEAMIRQLIASGVPGNPRPEPQKAGPRSLREHVLPNL